MLASTGIETAAGDESIAHSGHDGFSALQTSNPQDRGNRVRSEVVMKASAFARFRLLAVMTGVYLFIGALTRVVLWWRFGAPLEVGVTSLPGIFAGGLLNDAIESLYLFAPLALYILVLPDRRYCARWNRI